MKLNIYCGCSEKYFILYAVNFVPNMNASCNSAL